MRGDGKSLISTIEDSVDLIINSASVLGAYFFAVTVFGERPVDIGSYKTLLLLFVGITLSSVVYRFFGVNDARRYHLTAAHRIATVIIANFSYFSLSAVSTAIFAERGRLAFLLFWTVTAAFFTTFALILKKELAARLWRASLVGDAVKKLLIVGGCDPAADEFIKEVIRSSGGEFMIVGAVSDADGVSGCEHLGDLNSLAEVLDGYKPHIAVFSMNGYADGEVIRAVNLCDDRLVKVYFLPTCHGYFRSIGQIEYIGELPLVCAHASPLTNKARAAIKRAVDILGALTLLIFASPIMAAVAVGVKLSSPGPILFRQVRVGRSGTTFLMLKFRSMTVGGNDSSWSTGVDERKTRFGNFIRRTSLDELPQLFNVLRGEMSLVGPRPEIPRFVEYFKSRIPLYMIKHYVKPGMTGLAQINGLRGNTSIERRIKADLYYIENWSLALDFEILLKTPFKALNKNERLGGRDDG